MAIITIHHFNDFYDSPTNNTYREMFFSIWEQLTTHYKNKQYDKLLFEPLNEPHNNLTSEKWNLLIPEILKVIRNIDTERTLIIDVADYGYHKSITKLEIPPSEQNCIVSVRYYLPYEFTHQGAHWAEGSDVWLGNTWSATAEQKNAVLNDMDFIKTWAKENGRPVTVGEWGSIIKCDAQSRKIWTTYVRQQIINSGFSFSYFDFGVLFRAYNLEEDNWDKEILGALLGN